MRTKHKTIAALLLSAICLALPASAQAASPAWQIGALANSSAEPGTVLDYRVEFRNAGDVALDGSVQPITFSGNLPAGLTILGVQPFVSGVSLDCSGIVVGAQTFACKSSETLPTQENGAIAYYSQLLVRARVQPGASGLLSAQFEVAGGAPLNPSATTVAPATITTDPLGFGIAAFDVGTSADAAGAPYLQAAGHPYAQSTSIDFNTYEDAAPLKNDLTPVEATKDVEVELPPGFLGNPQGAERCTLSQLAEASGQLPSPLCPPSSQVGTTIVRSNGGHLLSGPIPVFNMVRPPDAPALFGFSVYGVVVTVKVNVRSGADYGVDAVSSNVSEGLALAGSSLTLWGTSADPSHDPERACPGERAPWDTGPTCLPTAAPVAFLREPTSCTAPGEGLPYSLRIDSWVHPGAFDQRAIHSHLPKGYPYPEGEWGVAQGPTGCANVPFEPSISAQPTTNRADSPSGLDVHIAVPQTCWDPGQQDSICQSDLSDAEVKLPQGMSLNPSAAAGLDACTEGQVGYKPGTSAPLEFSPAPANCPNGSKIGEVQITTPLLEEELSGAVYLAKQNENPFGSLLAMYLVAEGSGVVVKQAGEIVSDPVTGRLTTVFKGTPQQPFSDLHVALFGGPRAALRTPSTCGTYITRASFTPWARPDQPVNSTSPFEITSCPNSGFDPKLFAGTRNPLAGSFSPFSLRLSREDASPEIAGLRLAVPPGLVASLKDIPYCPDATLNAISGALGSGAAQIASPACPKGSEVGTVTAGAGAGPLPFYSTSGKAYWAGPYKGAPVSLAAVVPAVAGPFDLGNVVVRNGFEVDPETARITAVSDPFPQILHGIPLDLRDVRLDLNRPDYTLNPTSCEPLSFEADIASVQGAHAQRSQHFQATACDRLHFKPRLSLHLKGKTNRGAHPALRAVVTMPPGGANLAQATVALPHSEFLDQGHIGTICTRVQFAAGGGGGEQCPPKSIYGYARAYSPILGYYLQGPAFLRSSSHQLPDLVLGLHGPPAQPIVVAAVGRIDSTKGGGIRSSFESIPDVPVSKVVLEMRGGKKGLLQNSVNLCKAPHRATADLEAHNGELLDLRPELKADCGPRSRKGAKKGKGGPYRG